MGKGLSGDQRNIIHSESASLCFRLIPRAITFASSWSPEIPARLGLSELLPFASYLCVKSQLLLPPHSPGKDARMPKTTAVVQLPEVLRKKSSHFVKPAGNIDSFSLLLRETAESELKRSIEDQFHNMVFATRKEIRKYCPRYRSLPGEGMLDFNTDCSSAQAEPGDLGTAPPPKRGKLCETCCFFAGIPEEQVHEMTLTPAPQDLVLVVKISPIPPLHPLTVFSHSAH